MTTATTIITALDIPRPIPTLTLLDNPWEIWFPSIGTGVSGAGGRDGDAVPELDIGDPVGSPTLGGACVNVKVEKIEITTELMICDALLFTAEQPLEVLFEEDYQPTR